MRPQPPQLSNGIPTRKELREAWEAKIKRLEAKGYKLVRYTGPIPNPTN